MDTLHHSKIGHGIAGRLVAWVAGQLSAERERWVLWVPVGFGAGIAVYFALAFEPPGWWGAAGLAAVVLAGLLSRRRSGVLILVLAAGTVLAGFAAAQLRTARVAAPVLAKDTRPVMVTGQVAEAETREGGARVVLRHLSISGLAGAETPERVRVRLTTREPARVGPGDWIRVRAILRPPPGPAAPGAFDFARRAYFKRLGAVGFAVGHVQTLGQGSDGPVAAGLDGGGLDGGGRWDLWWSGLRHGVARQVLEVLPDERGAVAAALMTGDRSAIPKRVVANMRDSGLAHLLAISGLHMGLVTGFLFFGLRALMALSPALALNHPIKKWAAVGAALGAFAYLFLVGATVPAQRAFLMVSVVLLGVLLDRRAISLRLVAWAAFVVLLVAPESLLSASFQMSFAAVTALVAGYEMVALRRRANRSERRRWGGRLGLYVAGLALTSVIAILATGPFAVYHFNRIAWYGLAANLVAVPMTAFWIMPWAVLAFALLPLGLAGLALHPMGWGVGVVLDVAEAIAGQPGAVIAVKAMPAAGFALVVLGGLWLCLWQRPWRLAGLAVVILGLSSLALSRPPDVLVSADGKLLGVRDGSGGLWLSSNRASPFTAETWTRRAGETTAAAWPNNGTVSAQGRLLCDSLGCIYRARGQRVALALKGAALEEDCRHATVLISLEPVRRWRCPGPRLVIDRFDLWRHGAHAIWLGSDDVKVESAAAHRGTRPWSPGRPR